MATSTIQRNLPFLKQQISSALGNSSIFVKFLCCAVFGGYFLTFSHSVLDALTVIPGNVLPPNFWIWTYFTHSFLEVHVWVVICDLSVIVLYGKLLEPLWGAMEMVIFFLVVTTSVAFCTTLSYLFIYQVTRNPDYLFEIHIHGLAGYLAGFSVAVKQVMNDAVLVNSPFGKLRNRHIPMALLVLAVLVRMIGGVDGPYPIMFGMGLLASWVYLRFYQKHSNGNRGDMAESFGFASFFPSVLQPFIIIISNTIFNALVKIKVCKKPQRRYNVGGTAGATITVSLPGTDPQDAERRRQVAIKALNERLAKSDDPEASWPTLDEAELPVTPDTSSTASEKAPLLEVKVEPDLEEVPVVVVVSQTEQTEIPEKAKPESS